MNADSLESFWDWVWQTMWINSISTAILIPVVWLMCRIFDRRPAVQNLLWLLLLVKFMTPQLPGFAWVIPESIIGSRWNQASPVQQDQVKLVEETDWPSTEHISASAHAVPITESISNEVRGTDIPVASQPTIAVSPLQLVAAIIGSVWILGAGYFFFSICYGLRNQRKILIRATDAGQKLLDTVSAVAKQLGMRKLVPVQSSDIRSPFISCLGSVRLVWPTCLAASDTSVYRSLIAHEAAHVRRHDHFVAWLELIATLVWWWNPLFWFVRRRLRTSAEMACDAMALEAFPEDRCFYAEKLLELSACFKNGTQPLALAVRGDAPSSIERRLTMIVSERGSSKTTLLGMLIVVLFAIGAIPTWVSAQNTTNPPAPEPISWLLDPFMRRVPPLPQPIENQQAATTAPVLNNEEKLVLRLQAMYLVAISENRITDAEALAAAILAMTQTKSPEGSTETGAMPGGGNLDEIGGMPGVTIGDGIDQWSTVHRQANGNFDIPSLSYPKEVIRNHVALRIKVTGKNHGMVWGSNPYTDDSSLNAAAIHAGLVKAGETAELVFIRRPGRERYSGSESHGITTLEYGPYPSSFELAPASRYTDAPYLCDRSALRGNTDAYLSLNMLAGQAPLKPGVSLIVPLYGKDGGPIVGTDQYASDCNLDAAVVHAGVLKLGESGYVKIILAEGLEIYFGSNRNGIESYPYRKTKMSLRFERLIAAPLKPQPVTSLNDPHLRTVESITGGPGTAFVDADLIRAIEATSGANTTEPSASGPAILTVPSTAEQQLTLRIRVSSDREGELSSIAIGSQIWNAADKAMMDLERLRNLLSDSLRDVPYDRIEIHLENNLLYDRAREIMDACTRLRTHDGQPIDTVIVSAQADSDDHVAPTIEKEPSEPGSGDPVQIGFEDGKS